MPRVVYYGPIGIDVEIPPSIRRARGALALVPRQPFELTDEELAFVESAGHKFQRLDEPPEAPPLVAAEPAPEVAQVVDEPQKRRSNRRR